MLHHWHGGKAIHAVVTSVRVVCANTIRLAMETSADKLTIRHSGNLTSKLSLMRRYLGQFDKAFSGHCEDAQKLLVGYTPPQAAEYIAELFPEPAGIASRRTKRNRERQVQQVRNAFRSPAQQLSSVKGTWWALYNSVTEAVDHGKPVRQSRDPIARRENRFLNVIDGQAADFKQHAFELALKMAAI
jgi:phage/plasmid-like protein (TIGR03299 family)